MVLLTLCCERTGNNKTLETEADGIDKSQACEMNVLAISTDTTDGRHDDKPRPYWCNVCHKRFARRRYLNRPIHERMHYGEKIISVHPVRETLFISVHPR